MRGEGGALRHGHAGNLLISSRRPEQFVEHVAEPRFEDVHLGIRDRHARGPVVDDVPCLNVVFDWAAMARPGAGHDLKIGRQFAERRAVAAKGSGVGTLWQDRANAGRAERPISTLGHARPRSKGSGHGSTRLACDRERKVQFHPVMRHLRRDPPALAAFQADEAVARHRSQRARQV